MLAKYDGVCGGCGDDISAGKDEIGRHKVLGWIHSGCFDEEYREGRAMGRVRSEERKLYGDEFVEQLDLQRELFEYNHGLDY